MKLTRVLRVLAGLGLVGTLATGSGWVASENAAASSALATATASAWLVGMRRQKASPVPGTKMTLRDQGPQKSDATRGMPSCSSHSWAKLALRSPIAMRMELTMVPPPNALATSRALLAPLLSKPLTSTSME